MSTTVKLELSVREAAVLLRGLKALDGYERVVKDGEKEKIVTEHYKFSPNFVWAMAKNHITLNKIMEAFDEARKVVTKSVFNGKIIKPDTEKPDELALLTEANDQLDVFLDKKEEVELCYITQGELSLGENRIPPSHLAALGRLLK
jgi:hypothetical protein